MPAPLPPPDDTAALLAQYGVGDQGAAQSAAAARAGQAPGGIAGIQGAAPPPVVNPALDPTTGYAPQGYQSLAAMSAAMPAAGSPAEAQQLAADRARIGDTTPVPPPQLPPNAARDPSTLSFAPQRTGVGVGGSQGIPVDLAPRYQTIGPQRTPKYAPEDIAAIEGADKDVLAAQNRVGESQALGEATSAGYEGAKANRLALNATEEQQLREKNEREIIQPARDTLERASRDAANGKIVDWWSKQGTGDKIRFGIAQMLSSIGSAFTGGPNAAIQQINGYIDRDLQAQKAAIEAKRGRVEDLRGVLADAYKRTGNMEQAMALAHSLSLQQIDAEQRHSAALSNSQQVLAQSELVSKKIAQQQAMQHADFFAYAPGRTVQTGGVTPEDVKGAREDFKQAAENGQDVDFATLLRNRVAQRTVGVGAITSSVIGKAPGGGAGAASDKEVQSQARDYDSALADIEKALGMLNKGGTLSREERGRGASLVAGLANTVARAETGGKRAPSESEMNLLREQLGTNPAEFKFSNEDRGKLEQLREKLTRDRAALTGAPPPKTEAQVGFTPVASR